MNDTISFSFLHIKKGCPESLKPTFQTPLSYHLYNQTVSKILFFPNSASSFNPSLKPSASAVD